MLVTWSWLLVVRCRSFWWRQEDVIERLAWEAHAFISDQTEKAKAAPAIRWPPPPGDLVIISMGAGAVLSLQVLCSSQ